MAPSVTAFPGVAAEFGVSVNTLARCLGMVPVGGDEAAPTVATVTDPTKDHLLAPDPAFRGWAHPSRDEHTKRGGAWKGTNLVARQIAADTYAYPFSNKEGTTCETCLVMAHGEKAQGDGTLCHGCMARAGCTERYAYTRGGFAIKQGHVMACQTQVLAQLKCTFPDGVFDPEVLCRVEGGRACHTLQPHPQWRRGRWVADYGPGGVGGGHAGGSLSVRVAHFGWPEGPTALPKKKSNYLLTICK